MKTKLNAPQLDPIDNIFIRLCKKHRMSHLRRFAIRFYLYDPGTEHELYSWVSMIAAEIANKYFDLSLSEFLRNVGQCSANLRIRFYPDEFKDWNFAQMQNYVDAHSIVGLLSNTQKDDLQKIGYRSPLYFRLPEEKRASYEELDKVQKRLYEGREKKQTNS